MNAITGGKHKPQNQSGLGGIASSFLGGQGSQSGSGSGGSSGLTGQLLGSLLGGSKPHNQQPSQQSGSHGIPSSGGQQQGGLMGFFGGHGSSVSCGLDLRYKEETADTHLQSRTRTIVMDILRVARGQEAVATQAKHHQQHTSLQHRQVLPRTVLQLDSTTPRARLRAHRDYTTLRTSPKACLGRTPLRTRAKVHMGSITL